MPSPFPGMDPYLEQSDYWPECHSRLIVAIADALIPQLRPKYEVAIEKRIYKVNTFEGESGLLVGIPDVAVNQRTQTRAEPSGSSKLVAETVSPSSQPITVTVPLPEKVNQNYLEVRNIKTGRVVTAIEILSPVSKRSGDGRNDYLKKRQIILNSTTHLIEIDLLRAFSPMPLTSGQVQSDYRILVSRSDTRPKANLYSFSLKDALPNIPLPLEVGETEPIIELQSLINQVYDKAGFDYRVDYSMEPLDPLSDKDRRWILQLLQSQRIGEKSP
jgi:hypothetical protein